MGVVLFWVFIKLFVNQNQEILSRHFCMYLWITHNLVMKFGKLSDTVMGNVSKKYFT